MNITLPNKYFLMAKEEKKTPLWLTSIYERKVMLISLTIFLSLLLSTINSFFISRIVILSTSSPGDIGIFI
jgi:hypothetical protein